MSEIRPDQSFETMIDNMSREVWENLRRAVELGKWPDGRFLTPEQRQVSLQAVLAWEVRHGVPEEQRTGHIGGAGCKSDHDHDDEAEQVLTLRPAGGQRDA